MGNRPLSDRALRLAVKAEAENCARREACRRLLQWYDALDRAYFDSVPANDWDRHEATIWFGKNLQLFFMIQMIQYQGVGGCEWALQGAAAMLWKSTVALDGMRRVARHGPQSLLGQVSE